MAARRIWDVGGGSVSLVAVLTRRWDAIEADFARYYHLDLTDACFGHGQVGARKLWNLIRQLPADGAVGRVENPRWFWWRPEHEYVAATTELLAGVLQSSELHRKAVYGKKFRPVQPPELERPWRKVERRGFGEVMSRLPGEIEVVREGG